MAERTTGQPDALTLADVVKTFGVHEQTVRRWVRVRKITVSEVASIRLYSRAEIEAFLARDAASRNIPAHVRVLQRSKPDGDCLLWTGKKDRHGYGLISVIVNDRGTNRVAHRAVYEALIGPVPDGLHLDHLCRQTLCVKPEHLEPVTPAENMARQREAYSQFDPRTHCKRGHEFTPENTYLYQGRRQCRACNRAAVARRKARLAIKEIGGAR